MRVQSAVTGALASLAMLAVVGCSPSGQVSVSMRTVAVQGTSPAPPASSADGVLLHVERVDVHIAGTGAADSAGADHGNTAAGNHPSAKPQAPAGDAGWVTVADTPHDVGLTDVATFLGEQTVPAGKVTQIRLILSGADLVSGGSAVPLTCPSCSQTGIKIVTAGNVTVPDGGSLSLTLNLDQAASLTGDPGAQVLRPVIRVQAATH